MITEADYEAYLEALRARFPSFKVIPKTESPFCRLLDRVLRVLTAGGQSTFMSHYVTTIGARIYTPASWPQRHPAERYCVMRHEAVHLAQFRRFGLLGMTFLYLLFPLPMGFAGGRAWIEWEAYRETVIATWQVYGREAAHDPSFRADLRRRFTGPDYGWMWIAGGTIDRALDRLLEALDEAPPEALSSAAQRP